MNTKNALLFPAAVLFVLTAAAQNKCSFTLLRSPEDINAEFGHGLPIKNIRRSYKTDSILIKTPDKKKLWLANSSVWGYQDDHCTIYRNAFHDFLKTEEISDSIIIYSQTYNGFRGRLIKRYYFSKSFDTPAYKLDRVNIHDQFKSSPGLIDKLEKRFNL